MDATAAKAAREADPNAPMTGFERRMMRGGQGTLAGGVLGGALGPILTTADPMTGAILGAIGGGKVGYAVGRIEDVVDAIRNAGRTLDERSGARVLNDVFSDESPISTARDGGPVQAGRAPAIERVRVADIKFPPQENQRRLAGPWREGEAPLLLAREPDGSLTAHDGNHRARLAQAEGIESVDAVILPADELNRIYTEGFEGGTIGAQAYRDVVASARRNAPDVGSARVEFDTSPTFYHATQREIGGPLRAGTHGREGESALFLATDPSVLHGKTVVPVQVRGRFFDPENPEHVAALVRETGLRQEDIARGSWGYMENFYGEANALRPAMRRLGFDGMWVREGRSQRNLAVFPDSDATDAVSNARFAIGENPTRTGPNAGDARPVRVGEQVNRDGSVAPRDPIDWDADIDPQRSAMADLRLGIDPNDPVVRGVAGAGLGAGGAALLWPENAEAGGEGEAGGDDPLAYILGAGLTAGTLGALSRGRFADEFANSVGSNGGRAPRRVGEERIRTVTPEPAPTANAPRTERQPGSFFNDPRLNSANRDYAASRAADGLTPRQIAAEMDTTSDYVRILLTEARDLAPDLNIPLGRPGRTPDADGLTARARALRAQGLSYQEIGEALNITPTAAKSRVNNRLAGDRRDTAGAAVLAGIGTGALVLGEEAGAQERGEEITGIDLDGAVKITGHNLERNEDLDEDTVRHTTVWRLPDGSFVLRVQDQNTRNHNPEGPVRVFDLPPIEESERVLDGLEVALSPEERARHEAIARAANAPSETSSGGQRGQTSRNDRTPALALAAPFVAGLVGGRIGRQFGVKAGRPAAAEALGSVVGGAAGGFIAGTTTDADDALDLSVLGAGLGPLGNYGVRGAEILGRRGAEELANVRLPTPRRRRGQPLTPDDYVGGDASAPINQPGSLRPPPARQPDRAAGRSLDPLDLDAEMRTRARELSDRRVSPSPVSLEERLQRQPGERGALEGRLATAGVEPLRQMARAADLPTEGTVRDLASRLAEAARADPTLLNRYREIARALGVSGILLGGATEFLLPEDANADGAMPGALDGIDLRDIGRAATLTGTAVLGSTYLRGALDNIVPSNARIGALSRVGELPMDVPARAFDIERSSLGRAAFRNRTPAEAGAASPTVAEQLGWGVAAGALGGWGAAELIDPYTMTPQEEEARWMREVLPYLELRQQAARLFARGVRSNEVADAALAEELRMLERGGGDPLLNDYGLGPIGIPEDVQAARAVARAEEQKR